MFKWLKKHFIPHHANNHRPHFLRRKSIKRVVILVILIEAIFFTGPVLNYLHLDLSNGLATVLPSVLNNLANNERVSKNLGALKESLTLDMAAKMKAEDMVKKQYFAHISPDGKDPRYWLEKAGYKFKYAGENLAIDFSDSKDVTEAWMNSPSHRANIVKKQYTEVGSAIAVGNYEGHEAVYVVQLYGNPQNSDELQQNTKLSSDIQLEDSGKGEVLGAEVVPIPKKTLSGLILWDEIRSSPRHSMTIVFFVVVGLMLAALLLNIFVKIRIQHLDLITNGLIVIAIVFGLYLINAIFFKKDITIPLGQNQYSTMNFSPDGYKVQ